MASCADCALDLRAERMLGRDAHWLASHAAMKEDDLGVNGFGGCFDPCLARKPLRHEPARLAQLKMPRDANGKELRMSHMPPRAASTSAVPHLQDRFSTRGVDQLAREHDGSAVVLEDETEASQRLANGWTKSNDKKFRENEELCRAICAHRRVQCMVRSLPHRVC